MPVLLADQDNVVVQMGTSSRAENWRWDFHEAVIALLISNPFSFMSESCAVGNRSTDDDTTCWCESFHDGSLLGPKNMMLYTTPDGIYHGTWGRFANKSILCGVDLSSSFVWTVGMVAMSIKSSVVCESHCIIFRLQCQPQMDDKMCKVDNSAGCDPRTQFTCVCSKGG